MRTTIYYGPWQCSTAFMARCESRCAAEGYALRGCIWIADIKSDWRGRFLAVFPASAGGRLAITHCCCNRPTVTDGADRRRLWTNARKRFRNEWGAEFGEWPKSGGKSWPGHHIDDLWHGGDPIAPSNVLPVPPDIHEIINDAYPACYASGGRWSMVGPDRPYVD